MKNICFYLRVSGQEQRKNETIQTQLVKLREAYKNKKIIKEYQDICSGAYLQREGLNQLRQDAQRGLFNTICVYSLDRLSRKLAHQIALLEEFEKEGIEVEVLGENFENSPEGMLNRNIRGAFAEYERYKIAMRMKDGKYRKAEAGTLVASYPPFGYKYVKKTENCNCEKRGENHFEINPQEAKVVRLMFKTYLETHSQRQTAKTLEERGIKGRGRWKKEPSPINYRMFGRLLRYETYIGSFYFGKSYFIEPTRRYKENSKTKLTHRKLKPRSEWKLIKVPAIIDNGTFDRVQEILNQKAKSSLKPTIHQYLCQGLIKCLNCGRRYSGGKHDSYNGKSYYYYRCPQKFGRAIRYSCDCDSRSMSVEKLDTYVWQYIQVLISQPEKIKQSIKALKEKRESERGFNQKIYDSLIVQKAEIKKKKSKILDLYADENFKKEDLEEKISELNNQEEVLEVQIKEAEESLKKIETTESIEREIEQLCLEYSKKIQNPTFDLKKRIVRKWVKEINITDKGDIVIKVRIPQPEEPIKYPFPTKIIPQEVGVAQTTAC